MTISHAVAFFRALDQSDHTSYDQAVLHPSPEGNMLPFDTGTLPRSSQSALPRPSFFQACHDLIDALTKFDALHAERTLEDLVAATSVETVCQEIFRPITSEIRSRRARGLVDACSERFAHAFLQRKITALFNQSHPEAGKGPVVAAGVEGDHEELDLLFLSLYLSRGGFSVIYLGADIATPQLQYVVSTLDPLLVLLNASSEEHAPALDHAVRTLRPSEGGASIPAIGFTGEVFATTPHLRASINAEYFSDGYHAIETCDRLLQNSSNYQRT
jgi:methanogenic corrinoid protein MtbC1